MEFRPLPFRNQKPTASEYAQRWGQSIDALGDTFSDVARERRLSEQMEMERNLQRLKLEEEYSPEYLHQVFARPAAGSPGMIKPLPDADPNWRYAQPKRLKMFQEAEDRETAMSRQASTDDLTRRSTEADIEYKRAQAMKALREPIVSPEAAARMQDKREQRINDGVQDYGQFLEKTNIPGALSVAQDVLRQLPDAGENIPGYGGVAGKVPTLFVGDKGKKMRQAVFKMFNIELKDRSGAAVIDSELERLKEEFGSGRWSTEQQLRDGISAYVGRLNEIANNVVSSTNPQYVDEYQRRGGRDIRGTFDAMLGDATRKAGPATHSGWSADEESELAELEKMFGGR